MWYLGLFRRALKASQASIEQAIAIAKFWQQRSRQELNERQLKVIQRLLEEEPAGFEGGLTNLRR